MELVVKSSDEAALFAVQGVTNREGLPTAVTMGQQVMWLDAIAQEEEVPPFREHQQPRQLNIKVWW